MLSEVDITVRTKGGHDYKSILLRGMIASFERYLKRKKSITLISDFSISEKSQDAAVQARTAQTQLRRGNKQNGSVCLRENQRQVLYNKDLLKSEVQKHFSTLFC